MIKKDSVLLFDLGGVLIELNWLEKAKKLFNAQADVEELKSRWLNLESAREYESGRIDFNQFYRSFTAETGSHIDFSSFEEEFAGILGPVKPGCMQLLDELKDRFSLAMLSNTNSLHVEMLRDKTDIFSPFASLFFSYELKMIKPDHEIFHEVCRRLQCPAEQILFFDDSPPNVVAANACGLRAFRADGPSEVRAIIAQL